MKLTPAQQGLLTALADGEYRSVVDLAETAQVQRKWASRLLMRLVDDGVLEREWEVHNAPPMFRLARESAASRRPTCKGDSRVYRMDDRPTAKGLHDHIGGRVSAAWLQTGDGNYG